MLAAGRTLYAESLTLVCVHSQLSPFLSPDAVWSLFVVTLSNDRSEFRSQSGCQAWT